MHQEMAAVLDETIGQIRAIQAEARGGADGAGPGAREHAPWPMIVLRTPKGWTGPAVVDGLPVEGTWRAHQVPLAEVRTNPAHLRQLEEWMRSYRPQELFDADGRPHPELLGLVPAGDRRLGASPHANGGMLLRDLVLPDFRELRGGGRVAGRAHVRADPGARRDAPRRDAAATSRTATSGSSARTRPSRTG